MTEPHVDEERQIPDPPAPEMPRPYPITRIGNGARFVVEARPDECGKLARRMNIDALHSLTCGFDLKRAPGDTIEAAGVLHARIRQVCVVSLEPFDSDIVEEFSVRFVPEGRESDDLDLESADEIGYAGGTLDLGEAASEQLALALDPFPRKPGAELPSSLASVDDSPFAALLKLRTPQ
jgi:uncharacterized metal-binding protein YceD (DUF177 family)